MPEYVCKSNGTWDTVTPDGQPCQTGDDCTTDTGCDATTKLCTPAQYAQPGQPCDGEARRCVAGTCNKTASVCPQILADGAACNSPDSP